MKAGELVERVLHAAMTAMPIRACSDLGAALAPVMAKKPNPGEHRAAKALFARVRPDLAQDDRRLESAVDRLWANIARTYAEFAVSHRILGTGRVTVQHRDRLDAAMAAGRPVIAVFPHLGNWELSEMQFGNLYPGRVAVIYDPPRNGFRAETAHQVRSKIPLMLLPRAPTVWRHGIEHLATPGHCFMVAIDEEIRGRVRGCSLWGAPPLDGNIGKVARLALRTGALVLPFYNERLPGARFLSHYLPAMTFEGRPSDQGAVLEAATRINAVMMAPVRANLEQWYMALFDTA